MEEKTKSKGYVLRKLFFVYFYQFFQKQVDHFLQDRIYLMY